MNVSINNVIQKNPSSMCQNCNSQWCKYFLTAIDVPSNNYKPRIIERHVLGKSSTFLKLFYKKTCRLLQTLFTCKWCYFDPVIEWSHFDWFQNAAVMLVGSMIFTGCVVYITYLNRKKEAKTTYNALQEEGLSSNIPKNHPSSYRGPIIM